MEEDMFVNGNLLFNDWFNIKSKNLDFKNESTVGDGTGILFGFTQINNTHLAIVDTTQHCIKILDRSANQSTILTGQCGFYGTTDGNSSTARFESPHSVIIKQGTSQLLVTEWRNNALRCVNVTNGDVSTVVSSGLNHPSAMAWYDQKLLITNEHYIAEVSWDADNNAAAIILAGSMTEGYKEGNFGVALFDDPVSITMLTTHTFLVSDYHNDKIRVLDMNRRRVLLVDSTVIANPWSVLKTKDAVYVGQLGIITELTGEW